MTEVDDTPIHLRRLDAAAEPGDDLRSVSTGRLGNRPQLGVLFIDERGNPWQFAYAHLYRLYVEGDALVAEFSDHLVRLTGRCLWSPPERSLMRQLGDHRAAVVTAAVGRSGEFAAEGTPVVTAIAVTALKPER